MGSDVQWGRYTTSVDEEICVYLVGLRINKPWLVHRWWPTMRAVAAMLRELDREPALGMLAVRAFPTLRNVTVLQYWRSYADLQRYADADRHQRAFRYYFNKQYKSGALGIFHETYMVPAHHYEGIFVHMPAKFGLTDALGPIPAGRYGDTMAARMAEGSTPEPIGGEKIAD